ncbi:MAG: LamG-like jellyroll fold domain-containing protein, partial [Burkholderiales bacterium]
MGCARCHDHKYDPLTQKEFYQVYAFFNNVPESGKAFKYGNSPPFMLSPTAAQQKQLQVIAQKLAAAKARADRLAPELAVAQAVWEKTLRPTQLIHSAPADRLVAHFPLDASTVEKASEASQDRALRGQFMEGEPDYVVGRLGLAGNFDGKRFISAGDVADFGFYDRFSLGAWIYPKGNKGGAIVSRAKEVPQEAGYSLLLDQGKVQLNFVVRWLDDALRIETAESLATDQWHHVMATYDGSRVAKGVSIYVDGKPAKLKVLLDELNQQFKSTEPFRIGSGGGPESRFEGSIDEVRAYHRALPADEVAVVANPDAVN